MACGSLLVFCVSSSPYGAVGKSAVCGCDSFWSYSLMFCTCVYTENSEIFARVYFRETSHAYGEHILSYIDVGNSCISSRNKILLKMSEVTVSNDLIKIARS